MKVGYHHEGYLQRRNIINKVSSIDYVRVRDLDLGTKLFEYTRKIAPTLPFREPRKLVLSFNDFGLSRVDLIHLFQEVSYGKTPWVATFSHHLPRPISRWSRFSASERASYSAQLEEQILQALEAQCSEPCKKLIALSEFNLKVNRVFLRGYPQYAAEIEHKLTQLHPPQEIFVEDYNSKRLDLDGQMHFMFVGRAFFRKGGMEILEAFQEMKRQRGYDLKLSIVSSLKIDPYAAKETAEDVIAARDIIQQNSDWIDHHYGLTNEEVLDLMKTAHIGLLPTYADTYGYSTLEFQACGCPVISTNVCALPEINSDDIGWMIELPKNHLGKAIYETKEDRATISQAIKEGLTRAIVEIMEDRELVSTKANAAIKQCREQHSPEKHAARLEEIYQQALGRV